MNISAINWATIKPYLPLLTPAVKEGSCTVDDDLLLQRFTIVAAAVFATLAVTLSLQILVFSPFTPFFPCSLLPVAITAVAVVALDNRKANQSADQAAAHAYHQNYAPSNKATFRIRHHLSAAKLLVKTTKVGDLARILNKKNEAGNGLLDYNTDFDIFTLLVKKGANLREKDQYGWSYFRRLVNRGELNSLKWVLEHNIITPNNLDKEEQVQCWLYFKTEKIAHLLVEHRFNPNIQSFHKDGNIALARLHSLPTIYCDRDMPVATRSKILCECIVKAHK